MRYPIEFYRREHSPVPLDGLSISVTGPDFSVILDDSHRKAIDRVWESLKEKNPRIFSNPQGLATLYDATNGLHCRTTEFKDYMGVFHTFDAKALPSQAYDSMRIVAVEAGLLMNDGSVFVHKRPKNATHAADLWDSSCAGLCLIKDGKISPQDNLYDKLGRELGLSRDEVTLNGLTAIHSSSTPDFSGALDISLSTRLEPTDLVRRFKPGSFEEYTFVPLDELREFIVDHYTVRKDMISDGAATLMSMLDIDDFAEVADRINRERETIVFGTLREGIFSQK